MPRKPTIRFFASKNGYYTNHERTRYRLGDGPDDARRAGSGTCRPASTRTRSPRGTSPSASDC